MQDYYAHPNFIPDSLTKLSQAEATYALREAWKHLFGAYPTDSSLAILYAQVALETGRFSSAHNFNFGNIKIALDANHNIADNDHCFTMFKCGEYINGRWSLFNPPHYQTLFRAYRSATDGAVDYLSFITKRKRYQAAFAQLVKGNAAAFSHELSVAGYYTANEQSYTAGLVLIYNEFMNHKDKFMNYVPNAVQSAEEADAIVSEQQADYTEALALEMAMENLTETIIQGRSPDEDDDVLQPIQLSWLDQWRQKLGI